jgi:RNA polymerase sigma-70 factor (ECF subfamily)
MTLDYKKYEENKLIRLSQKGDETAFEELVGRNKVYINAWIKRFTKGDYGLQEEIFQQTLIKSWQRISQFKFKSNFTTWANAIARNNFYDDWRQKKRREHKFIYLGNDLIQGSAPINRLEHTGSPANKGPAFTFQNGEAYLRGQRIEGAGLIDLDTPSKKRIDSDKKKENIKLGKLLLDKLRPKHREVLVLYEIDGLSYPEIALALHVPIGTIMSRLFYARKHLNKAWKIYK